MTLPQAAIHCSISARTGTRWLQQLNRTGSFLPVRHRISIPGKMPSEDQEALSTIIANNRTCHIEELAQLLLEETNHNHSEKLIKQVMHRASESPRPARERSRPPELQRYWIEQVLGGEAVFTSDQFLSVDESSKK